MRAKETVSRAQAVTADLRARIAAGEWPVGSRIPTEPELCAQLGVGRSTLREAVRALTTLGMLEPLTARGTFVRSATPTTNLLFSALSGYDPAELVGLRRALDLESAQSAATERTAVDLALMEAELDGEVERLRTGAASSPHGTHCARFHSLVVRASGNRLLQDLDASLTAAMRESGLDREAAAGMDDARRIDDHDRILTAIRAGDVGSVAHHMAIHADAAMRSIRQEPLVTDLLALGGVRAGASAPRSA